MHIIFHSVHNSGNIYLFIYLFMSYSLQVHVFLSIAVSARTLSFIFRLQRFSTPFQREKPQNSFFCH
jgi:hypothetical protein